MNAVAGIKARYATSAAIERTVKAAQKAGLDVGGIEALPDGTIRIMDARLMPKQPQDLFEQLDAAGKL